MVSLSDNPIAPHPERLIGMLAYDGALMLNIAGPSDVFAMANREIARSRLTGSSAGTGYRLISLSPDGGLTRTSCGFELNTQPPPPPGEIAFDTIAIAGGVSIAGLVSNRPLVAWLRESALHARRVVSFGTGVFALAEAGLLEGRRCAAHWRICPQLRARYPLIDVDTDSVFVQDGKIMTAAGLSASMDLALQMVEDDFGKSLAVNVARVLLMTRMRPGDQPQVSMELKAQGASAPRIAAAAEWIVNNIDRKLSVSALAERFAMSERNFSRTFRREMGTSPQRFFDQARLEAARRWLTGSDLPVDKVARRSGFSSGEHLAQAFKKAMGEAPSEYRQRAREAGTKS